MNSSYFLFAVFLAISQMSHTSLPYASYYGDYPGFGYYGLAGHYPYAPFAYGAYPYGYPYDYPYSLHSHYHPRAALRNVAKSFHREDGHLSETDMISPFAKKN
ncbi:hypothetical protein Y032_0042g643 [Ancylostoma ceylanicum]|nr:hypothetical protein Y032_0042g643 [Ancylostoma ceylanicum]